MKYYPDRSGVSPLVMYCLSQKPGDDFDRLYLGSPWNKKNDSFRCHIKEDIAGILICFPNSNIRRPLTNLRKSALTPIGILQKSKLIVSSTNSNANKVAIIICSISLSKKLLWIHNHLSQFCRITQ
jgi:hypothetical protein